MKAMDRQELLCMNARDFFTTNAHKFSKGAHLPSLLVRIGDYTLREFCALDRRDILKFRNVGKGLRAELEKVLSEYDLAFNLNEPDETLESIVIDFIQQVRSHYETKKGQLDDMVFAFIDEVQDFYRYNNKRTIYNN